MKGIYKILGIGIVVVLLQSCLVAKHYSKPTNIVREKAFRTDSAQININPKDSTTMAATSWKDMFTDQLLQGYIDSALKNNPDNLIALQRIEEAKAYLKQGKAGYFPTLSLGANYTLSYPSKNGQQGSLVESTGKDHFNLFNLEADVSWEADVWGKIRSTKRAAAASYMQTVDAQKAIMTQLVANVAETYYQLLALDKEVLVTKETIKSRKKSWQTTKALKQAGLSSVTSVAVEQTKAQYLDAQALLLDQQNQQHLLENTMCLLMGEEPHNIQRGTLDKQEITTDLKLGVPMQLLSNRPDVMAAEMNYRHAFEMVNVARADFYPSITIGASGGLQSLQLKDWFSANSLFASFIGGLVAPIFNARAIRTQFDVAKAQQEEAKQNFRAVLIQSSKEVSDALYAYETATKKITIKQQEKQLLDKAVTDSQSLLNSGFNNISYLEVLTAQQNALNADLAVISTKLSQLNSMVDLYQALGGGMK